MTTPFASSGDDSEDGSSDGGSSDESGASTGEPATCGDGVIDPGEDCDDANVHNADGCNDDCTVSGSLRWSVTLGGAAQGIEDFFGVAVADDGRAYTTGTLFATPEDAQLWVREFDVDGTPGWEATIGASGPGLDVGRSAVIDGNTVHVAGRISTEDEGDQWWIGQFSLDGAPGASIVHGSPGSAEDSARGIAVGPAGRLYVTGRVSAATEFDAVVRGDVYGGASTWEVTHGGVDEGSDGGRAVAVGPLGDVVVVGYETVQGHGLDGWIAKYSSGGVPLWTRTYQGAAGLDDLASGVAIDDDGTIYAVGFETLDGERTRGWVRQWHTDGTESWTHTCDGGLAGAAVSFLDVDVDSAGHVVVVGSEDTDVKRGIIEKLDPSGGVLWTSRFGDPVPGDKRFRSVAVGPGDHIWAAGRIDLGADEDGFQAWLVRVAP